MAVIERHMAATSDVVLARHRCLGDDGTRLVVLEYRYILRQRTSGGLRTFPGARRWALETGEAVRVIDRRTFEVLATGELLASLEQGSSTLELK